MWYQGVTNPFFLDPQKAKVTGSYYTKHVRKDLLPACQKVYVDGDFVFTQDGASSLTHRVPEELLSTTIR